MITKAKKSDSKIVIQILNLAMQDIAYKLSGCKEPKSSEILEEFFKKSSNRLSYKNILVYKISDKIVGALCFYEWNENLDKPFLNHLKNIMQNPKIEKECNDNELYIDSLGVLEEFRNQGIAKKLIEKVYEVAKNRKLNLSLIALSDDEKVNNYYNNLGFKFTEIKVIYGKKYNHLIKEI